MSAERVRAFAPGRVNLIGEHTDYNDGLCLPFAIALGVSITATPTDGTDLVVRALDLGEEDRFEPGAEERRTRERPWADRGGPDGTWRRYVRGAAAELRRLGVELRPCVVEITGDVPRGAGLASSAALSVSLCLALFAVAGVAPPERVPLARLCSRIENEWVGARTGLLDQLASLYGERDRGLRIDMRGPELEPVPLELAGHRLVSIETGASRDLAGSGYNKRRAECDTAAERIGVDSLRDADLSALVALPGKLAHRVRHVMTENDRVDAMIAALHDGDFGAVGELLDASHRSLREDFECSVPAVEEAVERARSAGALGARMMGGGFGGNVLALFPPGTGIPQPALEVAPSPGARLL